MRSQWPWWLASGLAALGGLALAAAFAPLGWWPLAPIGIALITLAVRSASLPAALLAGFVGGLAFNLLGLRFVAVVGTDAWLVVSAICALWVTLYALAVWLIRNLVWWPMAAAALWATIEGMQARWPWDGFAWLQVGFSQADAPTVGLAALGGMPLLGFVVALAGSLLVFWVEGSDKVGRRLVLPLAAIALMVSGVLVPRPIMGQNDRGPAETRAAAVQGSVPEIGFEAKEQRQEVLENHVAVTMALAGEVNAGRQPRPDYVVWPENSSDVDPYLSKWAAGLISSAVDAIGVPVLVGAVTTSINPPAPSNVAIVWSPGTGPGEVYTKRHLLLFGEFVPFRSALTAITDRYDRVPMDYAPGEHNGVLQLGSATVGDVICYEIADDQLVRREVVDGARLLTVQTNNATFGMTSQPEQQLAMSRIRAIEHGRSVVIAATSGVTAIVIPDGTVAARAAPNKGEALVAPVPMRDTLTLSDRLQDLPVVVVALLAILGLVFAFLTSRTSRSTRSTRTR
ncbi:MAG: apolipoprotein N-acyltransferase [Candidatus Nanopelagicales bacterium]|nr:apolipoprotein N-acyltransferase [Candidatus Nanopelagicales bacterium]